MKPVEQGFKPIFVTEFNNQFDVPQLLHATRSKDKAFEDAGTSGKVIECVEIAALRAEQYKVKELVEAIEKYNTWMNISCPSCSMSSEPPEYVPCYCFDKMRATEKLMAVIKNFKYSND